MSTLGKSIRRTDARGRVTGETRFGGDLAGREALCIRVIRSPIAHGNIKTLDVEAARSTEGIVAVYTHEDIDGTNKHGLIRRDQEVFVTERVRYLGDALGIIVAEDEAAAQKALDAVSIEYEVLPIIENAEQALSPDAFPIHPEGNVFCNKLLRKGDAEQAIKDADVVVHCRHHTPGVDHAFLDLEAGFAELDGDIVVIHAPGQWVHEEQRLIALALGVPLEQVRIVQPATGGAFGGREDISIQIYLGLAARKLKRRVRIQYTRSESMISRHKRHPIDIEYTLAAKADGTLSAAKVLITSDEGAYLSTGPAVLRKAVSHCTGPYRVPNVWADGRAVFTNNNPTGAMRGFGAVQMAIAYEGAMVRLAKALGMDLLQLKKKNLLRDGEPITTGQAIVVSGADECLSRAAAAIGWEGRSYESPAPHLRRGYGLSCICFGIGYGDSFPDASRARVRFSQKGQLEVYTGAVDFGQGVHSMAAQIAGHELTIDPAKVEVIAQDTHRTPEAGSSSATRQTVYTGNAVRLAAAELRQEVLDVAASYTGLHWDELRLHEGTVVGKEKKSICMPIGNIVRLGHERGYKLDVTSLYKPTTIAGRPTDGLSPRAFITYMFASHAAEVVVDMETGEVKVERVAAAHDVGRAINPQQVEGQIEGGVVQGLGMALMEEVIVSEGRIVNDGFTDYIIPTIVDAPEIKAIIVEREDPEGPYGARGVGEPGLIGTPPAILGAIGDAIGISLSEAPMTAERIWHLITKRRYGKGGNGADGTDRRRSRPSNVVRLRGKS